MKNSVKKAIALLLPLILLLTFAGCEADNIAVSESTDETAFTYSLDNIIAFDVAADETVYALSVGENSTEETLNFTLHLLNKDNTESESVSFDAKNYPNHIVVENRTVYYDASEVINDEAKVVLMKYVIGEAEAKRIAVLDELDWTTKMRICDDTAYILGINTKNRTDDGADDSYFNSGEILLSYNLTSKEKCVLMAKGCVDFDVTANKSLLLYAHDENGFYIALRNQQQNEEIEYLNLGMIDSLTAVDDSKYVFTSVRNSIEGSGASMGLRGKKGYIDILNDISLLMTDAHIANENLYLLDTIYESESVGKIIRLDISGAISDSFDNEIKFVTAEYVSEMPSSLGFCVTKEELDSESFALTVLSQDRGFNCFVMSSRQQTADKIKNNGVFYPLNEVDGVKEYLDSCFPFLKEAASNENGDIWMLPIAMQVPVLAYNKALCTELGYDVENSDGVKFLELVANMHEDDNAKDHIGNLGPIYYSELLLSDYISTNKSFDNKQFTDMASSVKKYLFNDLDSLYLESRYLKQAKSSGDYSEIALSFSARKNEYNPFAKLDFGVKPIPDFTGNERSTATITYICVNPFSDNIDKSLKYISTLSKSLANQSDNLMLSKSALYSSCEFYKQLHEIYDNATARFSIPDDIVYSDYLDYLRGETSLDVFVAEADRKLATYLYE